MNSDTLSAYKQAFFHLSYKGILKPIFFRFDPERVHDFMVGRGVKLGSSGVTQSLVRSLFNYEHPMLEQTVCGIQFKNPMGLSAGFDKDARLTQILPEVGFGFEEVGSITAYPCDGNPKPRLQRLPKSQSLVVYYGLKNEGADRIHRRLSKLKFKFPVGISIARTNIKDTADPLLAIEDYILSYRRFRDIGDYYTINISCPNTYGGQPFTDPALLERLLKRIAEEPRTKPVFLKISPDVSVKQLDDIISLAQEYKLCGFVCTNLTKNHHNAAIKDEVRIPGGMSGKVVAELSVNFIRHIYRKTEGKMTIIGSGGIFNARDAYDRIKAGASLLQLITGMIYEGPQVIGEINRGLVNLLKQDNFGSINEAVGVEA